MSVILGEHPKIGIRAVVDGRRFGVREEVEGSILAMARTTAEFLQDNLRYPDGEKVECVVAPFGIGGAEESARAVKYFADKNVGAIITVTQCWGYGLETLYADKRIPQAIWGFNGTERSGAVYLAAAQAALTQKGVPCFSIYGRDVQDKGDTEIPQDVQQKLLAFARSAIAVALLKDKSYLSVGNVCMGIAGSVTDETLFSEYLGMRNEYVDMSEVMRRIQLGIFDAEEYERARKWVKENCEEGEDNNNPEHRRSRSVRDKDWDICVKMALILRDLMEGNSKLAEMGYIEEGLGHNAIAAGFQGQRQWTDFMPNGDFAEAILNSSFDWNGIRHPYILATENDTLNGVSMLLGYLLTATAQVFCDVRTFWSHEAIKRVTGKDLDGLASGGFIHLVNSGAACLDATGKQRIAGKPAIKPFWDITKKEAEDCLKATKWGLAVNDYFRGGGFSSSFISEGGMPMTMVRLNRAEGLGPYIQIAEGFSIDLDADVAEKINRRTDPTWPTTWFVPRTGKGAQFKDVYSVMNHWGANHCSLCYGHIGADLITLCSMLRIPVAMHNVEGELFRPTYWGAFGDDEAGADYRACKALGALYK